LLDTVYYIPILKEQEKFSFSDCENIKKRKGHRKLQPLKNELELVHKPDFKL